MRFHETIVIWLAIIMIVLVILQLWQNVIGSFEGELLDITDLAIIEILVHGTVEEKLIELTIGILVILSIAATLFSIGFQRRIDSLIDTLEIDLRKSADKATKNAYHAVSANIFHELAYQMFERIEPTVLAVWHGEDVEDSAKYSAQHSISLGLHYARSGLDYLKDHTPSISDNEKIRRVPGHLRNSFLWIAGAEIILGQKLGSKEFYAEHLEYVKELHAYTLDASTPSRPHWYQSYESMGFFLIAYGKLFSEKKYQEHGVNLVKQAVSGKAPKYGLLVPDSAWRDQTKSEYEKAGYDL